MRRTIIKSELNSAEFKKNFEKKVKDTIKKYKLFKKKEKIVVAVSGGKDSTVLLYLLNKFGYNIEAITVNALIGKYTDKNLENIKKFCNDLGVKLHVVSFRDEVGSSMCYLKSVLNSKGFKIKSCSVCGILRRYLINKKSRELKAKKIATGHNMDDEAQSFIMNLFRKNIEVNSRLGPITGLVRDKRFIPRTKPLFFCTEKEVKKYSQLMSFDVDYGRCPCCYDSYRNKVRELLNKYELKDDKIKEKIISSFLTLLPKFKEYYKTKEKPNFCIECSEPSKQEICKACQILDLVRK